MSVKRAFICVSGPGPLTTEIFNGYFQKCTWRILEDSERFLPRIPRGLGLMIEYHTCTCMLEDTYVIPLVPFIIIYYDFINIIVTSYSRHRDWFHYNLKNNWECALIIRIMNGHLHVPLVRNKDTMSQSLPQPGGMTQECALIIRIWMVHVKFLLTRTPCHFALTWWNDITTHVHVGQVYILLKASL